MKIDFFTHGKHLKSGGEANNYDGPLTSEAQEDLKKVKLSEYEEVFCGMMLRHKQTAKALKVTAKYTDTIGDDSRMFAALDGDDSAEMIFRTFLKSLKDRGVKKVLLITSRFYPLLMKYIERGGEKKLGPFQYFIKIMDDTPEWGDGTHVPLMISGTLSSFEF